MSAIVIVALIIAVPFLFGMVFRVNAALIFVSIMAGSLLVQEFADDASLVISSFVRSGDPLVVAQLVLQFLPIILMLLLARRTIGKGTVLLQTVPLLFSCALLGLLTLKLLPGSLTSEFYTSPIGAQVTQTQSLVIGAAAVSQLLFVWATQRPERHSKRHHGRSKH